MRVTPRQARQDRVKKATPHISPSHHTTHSLLSLQSHATRPPISATPIVPRHSPTRDPQQPAFHRLSKFLHFSRANAVPVRHIQPRDPLDVNSYISVLRRLTPKWYHRSLLHCPYRPLSQLSPQLDSVRSVFNLYTKSDCMTKCVSSLK
jgi:hypothetical protein